MKSTVSLGVASSLESLNAQFLGNHPLLIEARAAPSLAVVFGPDVGDDFRGAVLGDQDDAQPLWTYHVVPGFTPGLITGGLRRSKWKDVDVDARAPRLRTVRLPRLLVDSHAIIGASDLRRMGTARPLVALGLWAPLAAPIQRLGSLITGQREGLTAEIGLAIVPVALVSLANLTASGPLIGIVSADPIATELMALAIWQTRLPSRFDLAGPWEDHLVQRATELGLGATQPSQLIVETTFCDGLIGDELETSCKQLAGALSLIGVDCALAAQE